MTISVTFWGTRGTVPVPGPGTVRYGGNTPCVSVRAEHAHLVLDAGTGIRPLGHQLLQDAAGGSVSTTILLSHLHWDHIQGLPFFPPFYGEGNRITIRGPTPAGMTMRGALGRLMDSPMFPVPLDALGASLELGETPVVGDDPGDPFDAGGFSVTPYQLDHPGSALAFSLAVDQDGPRVIYVTDNELEGSRYRGIPGLRSGFVRFLQGSELLIHDAMFDEAVVAQRTGWGHSSPAQAVDVALEAGCARLVLFHHAPDHDDRTMDRLVERAREHAARAGGRLEIEAACEGATITL